MRFGNVYLMMMIIKVNVAIYISMMISDLKQACLNYAHYRT